MMKFFIQGVVFSTDLTHVVLIHKDRPDLHPKCVGWDAPGGKLEETDADELFGIMREVQEETGLVITRRLWKALPLIERADKWMFPFTAATDDVYCARTMEQEPVTVYPVQYLDQLKTVDWEWSTRALIQAALTRHGQHTESN